MHIPISTSADHLPGKRIMYSATCEEPGGGGKLQISTGRAICCRAGGFRIGQPLQL